MNWIERAMLAVAALFGSLALFCHVVVICMVLTGTEVWP